MKDKSNLYYKRVEVQIAPDAGASRLVPWFGYKCRLVRDPAHPGFVMEVMVPVELSIGKFKLDRGHRDQNLA